MASPERQRRLLAGMRGLLVRVGVGLVVVAFLYAIKLPARGGSSGGQASAAASSPSAAPLRVVLMVNGSLGDKSFYDSAARGVTSARQRLGLRTRVVEAGFDPTRWEPTLADLAEAGDFDVIVTGGFAMATLVQRIAPLNPQVRFILFDAAVDWAQCRCNNVHALLFRQNEGAFLAGLLAARHAALAGGPPPVLGVVGAMSIPVIDDFIVGFAAGVRWVSPDIQVLRQYVNSFTDPATGKEVAKAMFGRGAHLVFHAAAGSGQGVIEAAAESGRYAIGVDSDQYALFAKSQPRQAAAIVSSVLKNVDVAVYNALQATQANRLAWGTAATLGLAEGGVSLALHSAEMDRLPPAVKTELQVVQDRVSQGLLKVPSAFDAAAAAGKP